VDGLLVYHWRGARDVLYFECAGEKIVGAGWWMAGE